MPPLRSLYLRGEYFLGLTHHRRTEYTGGCTEKTETRLYVSTSEVEALNCLRYSLTQAIPAEGSHNGSAAVLKTAGRKAMQVRVLSPPPSLNFRRRSSTIHSSLSELDG